MHCMAIAAIFDSGPLGYGLETGTLRLQRPRLVVVSRGPQGNDVTLELGLGCKRRSRFLNHSRPLR